MKTRQTPTGLLMRAVTPTTTPHHFQGSPPLRCERKDGISTVQRRYDFGLTDLMKLPASSCCLLVVLTILKAGCLYAQTETSSNSRQGAMDRDLLEVTVPQLEQLYRSHKYTVTQVVRWYIARIEKYNGIYRAVQNLDAPGAMATAGREDAEAKAGGSGFVRGAYGASRLLPRQTPASRE